MTPFKRYVNNWYANRIGLCDLMYFQIHLTTRCQNSCNHCYFRELYRCEKDFPIDKLISFLSMIKEKSITLGYPLHVDFTGGDPFLYPHLDEIVDFCLRECISYGFKGNPEEIVRNTDKVIPMISSSTGMSLSLDGLEDAHDSIRSIGSFGRTMEAMRIVKESGCYLRINFTMSKSNVGELIPLLDYLYDTNLVIDDFTWARYWSVENREEVLELPQLYMAFDDMLVYMQNKINSREYYYFSKDNRLVPRIIFSFKEHQWFPYLFEKGIIQPEIAADIMKKQNCINCTATKHIYIADPDLRIYKCRKLSETEIPIEYIGTEEGCDYAHGNEVRCNKCIYFNGCGGCSAITKCFTGSISEVEPGCRFYKKTR